MLKTIIARRQTPQIDPKLFEGFSKDALDATNARMKFEQKQSRASGNVHSSQKSPSKPWDYVPSQSQSESQSKSRENSSTPDLNRPNGTSTSKNDHSNCDGYKRGLKDGRREVHDTLKTMRLFDNEAPKGKRMAWLIECITQGNEKGVNLLLELGANFNQLSPRVDSQDQLDLPLCVASRNGPKQIVESLLRKGAKVEDRDWFGNNALLSAASGGHTSIIKLLIDKWGANIDTRQSYKIGVNKQDTHL